MSFDVRAIIEAHPKIQQLGLRERTVAIGVLEGAVATIEPVVRGLVTERDRYRAALEDIAKRATVERNPDGDDQAAHTMQLIAQEALAASDTPSAPSPAASGENELEGDS